MNRRTFGQVELVNGDCLELLAGIADGSADLVFGDPPYSSGARTTAAVQRRRHGMSRGGRWRDMPMANDRMSVSGFTWLMRRVTLEACRVLKPGGAVLFFIDWRMYPVLSGIVEAANLQLQNLVVWDKETMALGHGFRHRHELLVYAAKGTPRVYNRGVPNVLRVRRLQEGALHPTEKPVELMRQLLLPTVPAGGLVIDAFAGSAPMAMACHQAGIRYHGAEIDPDYFASACRRMESALAPALGTAA